METEQPSFIPPDGQVVHVRKLEHWMYEKGENGKKKSYATVTLETVRTKVGNETSVETKEKTKSFDNLAEALEDLGDSDFLKIDDGGVIKTECTEQEYPVYGNTSVRTQAKDGDNVTDNRPIIYEEGSTSPAAKMCATIYPTKSQQFRESTFIQELSMGNDVPNSPKLQALVKHQFMPQDSSRIKYPTQQTELHDGTKSSHPSRAPFALASETIEKSKEYESEGQSPDIIAEAKKEGSRTYIIKLIMKGGENSIRNEDDPISIPEKQSVAPTEPSEECKFSQAFLALHNEYRARHNVPPLKISFELCKFSQKWADSIAARNVVENSRSKYGENIFFKSGFEIDPKETVDTWYAEGEDYPYGANEFLVNAGHFTQLIWKESKELGVGIGRNPTTGTYIVANYYPPGNTQGRYNLNILPRVH